MNTACRNVQSKRQMITPERQAYLFDEFYKLKLSSEEVLSCSSSDTTKREANARWLMQPEAFTRDKYGDILCAGRVSRFHCCNCRLAPDARSVIWLSEKTSGEHDLQLRVWENIAICCAWVCEWAENDIKFTGNSKTKRWLYDILVVQTNVFVGDGDCQTSLLQDTLITRSGLTITLW